MLIIVAQYNREISIPTLGMFRLRSNSGNDDDETVRKTPWYKTIRNGVNNSLEWSIDDEGARSSIQEEAVTEEEERCKCIYRQFSCGTVLINSNSHGCHHHHDQERTIKNKILG